MNAIVDTALLFDYEYMREKIRERLKLKNLDELPNFHNNGTIKYVINALSEYGIRIYGGFVNHEKGRVAGSHTPLVFYTDTNVKVYMSNICYYSGAGISITFSSEDGKISCSASLMPGDGRLSGDLTDLKKATPYIDPAIYLDYLLCCPTSEVIHAFTKHEPLLTRLMEENTKLWDEVVELKEENIRLSKYNKTLETTNAYITEENNGWIESEQISNSEIRYMKDQLDELQETANEKQAEIDRIRYTGLSLILYFAAFGILAFLNVIWYKR